MSYATYIVGKDALLNPGAIALLDEFGAATRRQKYLASWRILHIDRFERVTRPLPASTGHKIQFYSYAMTAPPSFGGK